MSTYKRHAHAVLSAIGFNPNKTALEPRHLRVGIDMGKADTAGLVNLLIDKGVLSAQEYIEAVEKSAAEEVERQKQALARELGIDPAHIQLY